MHRNKSVNLHQFAMIPRADVPRSSFDMQKTYKTTFDSGYLIPVFCEEMLPGDTFNGRSTMFARLATPLYPYMDNMYLDCFYFFVPNRLVWTNWVKFMGQQNSPGDSISYSVPQIVSPVGGYDIGSVYDYFGLPTVGQVGGAATVTHSALPIRAYALIYDQWFRDENLEASYLPFNGDGPDPYTSVSLRRRGKRHDYFTSCLPFAQKGTAVSLPLTGNALVKTSVAETFTGVQEGVHFRYSTTGGLPAPIRAVLAVNDITKGTVGTDVASAGVSAGSLYPTNLYADLSTATAATINQLRQSFQIQKLLERDARGGTRYTEIVLSHFGVQSPDARLQRPEYIGGGSTPINVNPIAQTSATTVTGTDTPQGNLAAMATALTNNGFTYSATEHGYVIGLVSVRADLTYQQGLRRHWSRLTRYDYYFPVFAMLGEQAVLSKEIYCDGSAGDNDVFGYQERWGEYRYLQSEITGLFRSTAAGTVDQWHLAQNFVTRPTLSATFIRETPPVERVVAVGSEANGQQFLLDCFFSVRAARPMPLYSVPGLIDHF